jgi:hypothetical protein
MATHRDPLAQYLGPGDPMLAGYYPRWLDNLADDATLEGSLLEGVVQGADAIRAIVLAIRGAYDRQEHKYAGPSGDGRFLEDYVAEVRGVPLGCIVLVTFNAAGQAQTIAASYRPRRALLLLSQVVGETFAGTVLARQFAASDEAEPSHPAP